MVSNLLVAQNAVYISPEAYQFQKDQQQLSLSTKYILGTELSRDSLASQARLPFTVTTQSALCDCMIPLDSTFQVVPFSFVLAPDYRNDDHSTSAIAIPFQFNFFGQLHDSIYINNNGNISFDGPYGTFTAASFPSNQYKMIAPFWSDVDTRDSASGLVYYKITPTYIVIRWDSVGYYSYHTDKRNTFQLIITDGLDTILPPGDNVSFCYGDMEWTTGDASMGINGFGGDPSTTGVNVGNGSDYFQVTQCDANTNAFDGPYNTNDGINWLDNMEITFNTTINGNVPPLVMNNTLCDTIDIFTGDTIRISAIDSIEFDFYVLTPEIGQTVTASISTNAPPSALTILQTTNFTHTKIFHCTFDARNISPGFYTITATGIDNGTPALQSYSSVYIQTYFDSTVSIVSHPVSLNDVHVFPNPAKEQITIDHSDQVREIVLLNIFGEVVSTTPPTDNQTIVNLNGIPSGAFFIRVIHENGNVTMSRFIKQ